MLFLCDFINSSGMQGIFLVKSDDEEEAMELAIEHLKTKEIEEYYGKCSISKFTDLTYIKTIE